MRISEITIAAVLLTNWGWSPVYAEPVFAESDPAVPSAAVQSVMKKSTGTVSAANLRDLWSALVRRNADIQFAVSKFLPPAFSSEQHALLTECVLQELGDDSAGTADGVRPRLQPEQEARIHFIEGVHARIPESRKVRLKPAEEVMLYSIIRTNAQKLLDALDAFRHDLKCLSNAQTDLADLKNLAKGNRDDFRKAEIDYTIRKAERDLELLRQDYEHSRANLVQLVGRTPVEQIRN